MILRAIGAATIIAFVVLGAAKTFAETTATSHKIVIDRLVTVPEEGLLLGNGDLSVSVYQTADRIIWRFGKNDVWDRRLDLSDDPKPAHIDEIAKGIAVEGWKCPPYGGGPIVATHGTDNPERMKELCVGAPPSYNRRPYPCPKPLGELALQLPPDQMGLEIHQELRIEDAMLDITCSWPTGLKIYIHTFIPPSTNVLVAQWSVEGWNDETRTGNNQPPLTFSLYRWKDPSIQEFGAQYFAEYGHSAFASCADPKATPLSPPSIGHNDSGFYIEQTFPPDPTFPDGFSYVLAPSSASGAFDKVDTGLDSEARLRFRPGQNIMQGDIVVTVATTSDNGGAIESTSRIRSALTGDFTGAIAGWKDATLKQAQDFWSHSSVRVADPLIENIWYETLHARRCTNRPDTPPPGLMLPSTVQDYSHWHGDYHTNYNLQEPFWGDYTANHFDIGDAYFKAIDYFLQIGRKIAHDYYNCRGAFIQLSGYPINAEDDPLGCVPMGRMAYMTGWAMNQYWQRYLYSMDKEWLREKGYPVIKDCALFYTDFFKKGEDGLFHAFPSNQGEDGFTGDPKDYTDRPQIMQHARYCLRAAIRASEILDVDQDLRSEWIDRVEHCAGDDGRPVPVLSDEERRCSELNPPEFGLGRPYKPQPETPEGQPWPPVGDGSWTWYCGQYGCGVMQRLRGGEFIADRDFPVYRKIVERWRRPNGLVWGMSVVDYGHTGAWTETLGITAPLQEMMLQSWDGALRVFPAWPKNLDASFTSFRAEGAFLVSASWEKGRVASLRISSEKGQDCRLYSPWREGVRIFGKDGSEIATTSDGAIIKFQTMATSEYELRPKESQ